MESTRIRQELAYIEPITRADAFDRTVAWQRAHPPQTGSLDAPDLLDYATEDKILAALAHS